MPSETPGSNFLGDIEMKQTLQMNEVMDPEIFELKATNEQLFRVVADLKKVVHQRDAALNEMIEAHFEAMYILALGADFREGRDGLRLVRIGAAAEIIARAAGMPDDYCAMIRRAAPLHDIGMVAIPDDLLRKQDELDEKEWQLWRSHTEIGARILSGSFDNPLLRMASEIALTHHENFKGRGYPAKLVGEDIPLSGRIVALAEYFETHTNKLGIRARPLPTNAVLGSIRELSGHRFDPRLVELFQKNVSAICAATAEVDQRANSFQELVANSKSGALPL
jgi:putative two-component system response regulator